MEEKRTGPGNPVNPEWYGIACGTEHVTFVRPHCTVMFPVPDEEIVMVFLGQVAGTCYASPDDKDACIKRVLRCIKDGHHSPLEHFNITISCLTDRGTSHALVRHRHCAFQQSSTIYQRYSGGIMIAAMPVRDPCTGELTEWDDRLPKVYEDLYMMYAQMVSNGVPASRARDVLPTALATQLIITANIRQWMYMIQRRIGKGDAVRMHVWATQVRRLLEEKLPKITAAFAAWYAAHPL